MNNLKIVIVSCILILFMSSCVHETFSSTIKYTVVDTTVISHSQGYGFDYSVIIKIDSTYYSALLNRDGELYKINRKLNIKKIIKN